MKVILYANHCLGNIYVVKCFAVFFYRPCSENLLTLDKAIVKVQLIVQRS